MNTIRVNREGRWVWIILNRPDKRNALNHELIIELDQVLADSEQDPEVRVVILTGEGKAFCSGLDLSAMQQLAQRSYEENLADSRAYGQLLRRIYLHPKPVIAAVNGPAVAGGCGLATVCDLTLAVPAARFGYTEARVGFVAAIVACFLVRGIGERRARELLLSARLIDAQEAHQIGLVHEVVDPENLHERTVARAEQFCANSPQSLGATKSLLARLSGADLDEILEYACELNARSRSTPDCIEGVAAFLEKRAPRWQVTS